MKTRLATLIVTLALCAAQFILAGCKSPEAYKTLKSIAIGVDAAMRAYSDAVVAGKVSADLQEKVRDAKKKYEASFNVAFTAARFDEKALAPAETVQLATELITLTKLFLH